MDNMIKPEKVYFQNLDALRSIACLFVLVSHTFSIIIEKYFPGALEREPVLFFFFSNGGFGVRIFFTLSGFLITYLIIKEILKTGKLQLKNFYIRRVLRIWPVYFAVVIFVFVIYGQGKILLGNTNPIHENPLFTILFLSNYDLIRILNTPGLYENGMLSLSWSVSVEEQFYLIWPLLFFTISLKGIRWALVSILIISIIFSFYHSDNINLIYHHTVSNLLFLSIGALLAYIMNFHPKVVEKFKKISKLLWLFIFLFGLILLIFLRTVLMDNYGGMTLYFFITAIIVGLFILNQVAPVNRPFELGSSRFLVNMGKYTYGLYMYHRIAIFFITLLFSILLKDSLNIWVDIIYIICCFLLSYVISFLSYKYMELPLLRLKDRFSHFRKN